MGSRRTHSSRRKSASSRSGRPAKSRRKTAGNSLPDLHAILNDFSDALSLVKVALNSIHEKELATDEETVLRSAVVMLDRVYDAIDDADCALWRARS